MRAVDPKFWVHAQSEVDINRILRESICEDQSGDDAFDCNNENWDPDPFNPQK